MGGVYPIHEVVIRGEFRDLSDDALMTFAGTLGSTKLLPYNANT